MAEERRLTCPFCFANRDLADFYCVEEGCAWWSQSEKVCAMKVIAENLGEVSDGLIEIDKTLMDINGAMP